MKRWIPRLLAAIILLIGIAIAAWLLLMQPQAARSEQQQAATLVAVTTAQERHEALRVVAYGSVRASEQVRLRPQVSGRVVWVREDLEAGARYPAETELARIEAFDFEQTLRQREAELSRARAQLLQEQGQQTVAQWSWRQQQDSLRDAELPTAPALALRQPQLQAAEAVVQAASAARDLAERQLQRTSIRPPSAPTIVSEQLNTRATVGPESVVAELSGTGQYQVLLTVPQADLPLILPLDDDGQRITVLHELGQQRLSYQGRLLQLLPSIDERGRLAQILIAIDDPLQATGMPLLLGSFVEVHIRAAQARDYIVVPSDTVHRDNTIYIMQDGELALRQVGIARRGREETWISEGLEAGTSVISSPLPNPVPGMSLRVARNGDAQATDASRQEADE